MPPPSALRRFLSAPAPQPNAIYEPRRLWSELVAEIDPVFLRPTIDVAAETEAWRVASATAPGHLAEALIVRGLLPEDFDRTGRFLFASRLPRSELFQGRVPLAGDPPDEDSLPALVGRWAAVAAALDLLDVAAERLAPWGWRGSEHRVVVTERANAATILDRESRLYTRSLSDMLHRATHFAKTPARTTADEAAAASPGSCGQPARILSAHATWRSHANRGALTGTFQSAPPPRPFAEAPDPYAPMVDVMRLGLGCRSCSPIDETYDPTNRSPEWAEALMLVVPT